MSAAPLPYTAGLGQVFLSVPFCCLCTHIILSILSFLFFCQIQFWSALAFLTPSLHDPTTFAEQPTHATPWHSGNFQGWSRFLNLPALTVKIFNYLQRKSSSLVSNSISGGKNLLKPKKIQLQIPSSYTTVLRLFSCPTP